MDDHKQNSRNRSHSQEDPVGFHHQQHHQQEQQQEQQRGRSNTDPTATSSTQATITPSPSVPSLLSPVGESRNYCIALDEDDIIDLSAVVLPPSSTPTPTPSMIETNHSKKKKNTHINNRSNNRSSGDGVSESSPSPSRFSAIFSPSNGDYLDGDHFGGAMSPLICRSENDDDDDYDDEDVDNNSDDGDGDGAFFLRRQRQASGGGGRLNHRYMNRRNNNHEADNNRRRRVKLNGLNYLNVLTYGLNAFMSFCIGYAGLWGILPTRWEISKDYETLVTPAEFAYYLWSPILVFELIFALAQLLPNYRARPIIQQGTGYFFFWTCVIQTAWTMFFAFKFFICSFVCAVLAMLMLASLLASQHYYCVMNGRGANHSNTRSRRLEYWLFRFPFYLHCGWLIMCSIVQFSIIFRYYTSNIGVQLSADIFSLGVMLPAATFFLTGQPSGPDFVIPIVVIWSYASIAIELNHPSETLIDLYGHSSIVAVRNASMFFAGTVGVMLIPRVVIWIAQEFCTISVVEFDDEEGESQYRFPFYSPPTYHHTHPTDNALNSGRGFSIQSIEEEYDHDDARENTAGVDEEAAPGHPSNNGGVNNDEDDDDFQGEFYDAQNFSSDMQNQNTEEETNTATTLNDESV
eukprot:CAMPEP_0113456360 /NCGR_PEP_ID=MMETSP0014_2-20120614/8846_1 /TAXON_ID=2857 /ORGANISM="Nitzschia sp." /LENGTH=631 /DNA_ID=CAMNT_0000347809 /DNA_START=179 /DNA_END=2074 /DNA_ORIENTATION=- /assembly_acc=CAM_ASM_000159